MEVNQFIVLTLFVLSAGLVPIEVYLAIRCRVGIAERTSRLGELQMLIEEVSRLNEDVVSTAKRLGIELRKAPRERTHKEWTET